MSLLWLPTATRDERGGFAWQVACPYKGVLHTTESPSWPNYPPRYHPNATVRPIPGVGVEIRQHASLDQATYALVHASGTVATNGARAIQFELVGTCDPNGPKGAYRWFDADDAVLTDLWRKVIKPVSDAYRIKIAAPIFKAYPASYGAPRHVALGAAGPLNPSPYAAPVAPGERTEDDPGIPDGLADAPNLMGQRYGAGNGVRFTEKAWLDWDGFLGHEHVPGGNVHGDPGAFPWDRLMGLAGDQPKPPTPKTADILGPVKYGDHGPYVRAVQHRLDQQLGVNVTVDGAFGRATLIAVQDWQKKHHLTPDGVVGPATARSMGLTYAPR